MTRDAALTGSGQLRAERRGWLRWAASAWRFIVAVFFCLTPVTAVLVLGWLMRLMARESQVTMSRLGNPASTLPRPSLPTWVVADEGGSERRLRRWFGALIENARLGLAALLTIAATTLPFTVLWLLSWWGGWENSFNKGYEQAWVGPLVGLIGVVIALPLLTYLPMALAHQAAEGRMAAFFQVARVRRLIRRAGWRYVGLCLLVMLAALPLFVVKAAPTFVEGWSPGFLDRNSEEIAAFAATYRLWATVYVVLALIFLRRLTARLYGRAVVADERAPSAKPLLAGLGTVLRTVLIWSIWLGLIAQLFVGQFVNHLWIGWLNPPLVGLPWLPLPGAAL